MEERKLAVAGAVALVSMGAIVGGMMFLDSEPVDCEEIYDQAKEGEIEPDEIPEECEPVPEDVEQELLLQALGDS